MRENLNMYVTNEGISMRCSNSLISCSIIHIDKSFHKIIHQILLSPPIPILAWRHAGGSLEVFAEDGL